MKKTRKVIFLDIDGVLQPLDSEERFKYINESDKLKEKLVKELNDEVYLKMHSYDLCAVYYDWNKEAVANLKKVLDEKGAELVISSSWREYSPIEILKGFFKIHGIEEYVTEYLPFKTSVDKHSHYRANLIQGYLDTNKDIEQYLVLDDINLSDAFPTNYINTLPYFSEIMVEKALMILDGKIFEMREEVLNIKEGSMIEYLGVKYSVFSKVKYNLVSRHRRWMIHKNIVKIEFENKELILYFPQEDYFYLMKKREELDIKYLLERFDINQVCYSLEHIFTCEKEKIFCGKEKIHLDKLLIFTYYVYNARDAIYLVNKDEYDQSYDTITALYKLEKIEYNEINWNNK